MELKALGGPRFRSALEDLADLEVLVASAEEMRLGIWILRSTCDALSFARG